MEWLQGGRHVDYVADQMVQKLIETIKKKVGKSTVQVKPFQVSERVREDGKGEMEQIEMILYFR